MKRVVMTLLTVVAVIMFSLLTFSQSKDDAAQNKQTSPKPEDLKPEQQVSKGSVTVGGKTIAYDAYAGT
ncbi:MAG TPA: hypothetical protein VEI49_12810, partial [Terriglobales bacterium]|nr:hypothetical protein [Terriglobales bacterium]